MNSTKTRVFCLVTLVIALFGCTNQEDPMQTLFTKVSPTESGVDFINDLNERKDFNLFTWKYIYNGGGVAIGDINNDGLADLYFSGNANANKLYLNKGNFKFEDITLSSGTKAAQGYKTGISMVDINGDGWLDIYVCRDAHPNENIRNNLVFINNKDLTFTEQGKNLGLQDKAYSTQSVFFDMDRDGDLDLFLVNHPADFDKAIQMRVSNENGDSRRITAPESKDQSYHLYVNNLGHFEDITEQSGLAYHGFGLSALAADFNDDGWLDLFVANDFIEPDVVFLNNGDQTFTPSYSGFDHMSQNSMGSDLGDMNNDGELDLIVLDMLAATNERQKIFATNMTQNRYERLADMGYGKQLMRNVLQLKTGPNAFSEIGCLSGIEKTDWSWSALFADLNLDGHQDLFITNGIKRDMSNKDFIDFNSDSIQRARQQGVDVFNRETVLDWIDLIPSTPLPNYLYLNNHDFTFTNIAQQAGLSEATFSHGAAYGDLDNDGDLDLVVNNMDLPASIYQNNSIQQQPGSHFLKVKLHGPEGNPFGLGARVIFRYDEVRQTIILQSSRGYLSSSEPVAHFGLSTEPKVKSIEVIWPDQTVQTVTDFAIDQTLEIGYQPKEIPQTSVKKLFEESETTLFTHQDGTFNDFKQEPLLFKPQSRKGPHMTLGDLNGDGLEDVFVGGGSGQSGAILLQKKDGAFQRIEEKNLTLDLEPEDLGAALVDLDLDGDLDLYVVSGGSSFPKGNPTYQDRLYLNDGKGRFQKGTLPKISHSGTVVKVSDFDQDGDPDLFIGGGAVPGQYPSSEPSILLENRNGQLVRSTLLPAVEGIVNDALWWDYNEDGYDDLILAGEWMPITILKNQSGKSFENVTEKMGLSKSHGLWNSLVVLDLDGDEKNELMVGNLGLNHLFEVSSSEPITAYQSDFDENDQKETIITHYLNGERWPLPRKETITGVLPHLKKKFINNQTYAEARLEDIFSSDQLAQATTYNLYELRSGYFTLREDSMIFSAFPTIAQSFPIYDMVFLDLNGDQVKDLLLGGNMSYSEVEQGPYDAGGGLILWGTERALTFDANNFQFLNWTGDIRKMSIQNVNGTQMLWVVQNNGPLKSYNLVK